MIQRVEDIAYVASATVARWQAEALEIIRARQAALQEGDCFSPTYEDDLRHRRDCLALKAAKPWLFHEKQMDRAYEARLAAMGIE